VSPNPTRGLAKVSRDIFFQIFEPFLYFGFIFRRKRLAFLKMKMSRHTGVGGGGNREHRHHLEHGERGLK